MYLVLKHKKGMKYKGIQYQTLGDGIGVTHYTEVQDIYDRDVNTGYECFGRGVVYKAIMITYQHTDSNVFPNAVAMRGDDFLRCDDPNHSFGLVNIPKGKPGYVYIPGHPDEEDCK